VKLSSHLDFVCSLLPGKILQTFAAAVQNKEDVTLKYLFLHSAYIK